MRVSIFGLGYVGLVSAACLARDGHTVIGVDLNPEKNKTVAAGRSPIVEPGLEGMIKEAVEGGMLEATADGKSAVERSDVSMVCVGTPSNSNGSLDLQYVSRVAQQIGEALATRTTYHVVVIRSTVLPGTVAGLVVPTLEAASGRKAGSDFGVSMNPEFLREGCAIEDYYSPSQVIIGELDDRSGDSVEKLYQAVDAPAVRVSLETAEMVKYVNNAFHALKVGFANEIGNLCKSAGINGREVMDLFCRDKRLNLSASYLMPGFAFGGSCLPKDLRALMYRAKEHDVDCPVLESLLESNRMQVQRGIEMVEKVGRKRVGILGLSFKAGTDDVRESPVVPLIEALVGRGYDVSVFDDKVEPGKLIGANRSYLDRELPHIASLMRSSLRDLVANSEVIVVANGGPNFGKISDSITDEQFVVDLVGLSENDRPQKGSYHGICW